MWVIDPLANQHGMTAVDAYMPAANRIRIVVTRFSAERYGRRPNDRCLSRGLNQDGDVGGQNCTGPAP